MNPLKQAEVKEQPIPASVVQQGVTDDKPDTSDVIPIGPRFQAELPPTIMSEAEYREISAGFKSTKIWSADPIKDGSIGKGRLKTCSCEVPGSIECSKKHIKSKRFQLQREIGAAFWRFKFDGMGEEVSKLWSAEEQEKFHTLVKSHAGSSGQTFMSSAMEHLPCQSRESILSYYWNVHVPRRMSAQSEMEASWIDTDDESEDTVRPPKGSRKRMVVVGVVVPQPAAPRFCTILDWQKNMMILP